MFTSERNKLPTQAQLALEAGHKIEAIRIVREQTGLGLREARAVVERASREGHPQMPRLAAGKEDSGVLRLVVVVMVLGALGAAVILM